MSKKRIWLIIGIILSVLVTLSPLLLAGCVACLTSNARMEPIAISIPREYTIDEYEDIIKPYEAPFSEYSPLD